MKLSIGSWFRRKGDGPDGRKVGRLEGILKKKEELRLPSELPEGWEQTGTDGLSGGEAAKRKKNNLPRDDGKPTIRIITENVFTLFNGLNLLLALALLSVQSYRNSLFIAIVIANTGISIIQEIRARNTIRKLKLLNMPKVRVIRDGREESVAPEETAEGDLIVLRSGDQIVADCVVVSGFGRANESLLTGESDGVQKTGGDWLYSGSYLTEGKILCQAVYVGEESYIGRLTREAKAQKTAESGLMREMKRLIRWDSYALIPLGILLYLKQTMWQQVAREAAIPSTVAAMLGMIPEGLILMTSLAMAIGVIRLGRRQVLVQELYGIEGLARVDVICLDKTGTLTSGKMKTEQVMPVDCGEEEARAALSRFLGAFDDPGGTLEALREAVAPGKDVPVVVQPFSSERKKSAASFEDWKTLILGAPEFVWEDRYPEALRRQVGELTARGRRVLILAEADGLISGGELPEARRTMAICSLADEMRPHVEETTRYFREQGVELKVISGDNPGTVSRVAQLAGLENWDRAVDARELKTPEELREACERYTVFGRVKPDQKKQLVEALKAKGHTVAMTGDGVNDIPALRAADCSIAMAEGADAARNTAMLTLLESDFAAVPDIVLEGRRVINNITRSATLFLTKTIFSFLLSLLTLALPGIYPFQPIQMSLVSSFTVGIPGFFLALESSRERVKGKFLSTVLRRALPGGVAVALCATLAMLLTHAGWSTEVCSTLATWMAGIMGIVVLVRVCWPFNLMRACVTAGALAAFVLCATLLGHVFYLVPLTGLQWAALAGLTALGVGIYVLTWYLEKRGKTAKPSEPSEPSDAPEAAEA